MAGWAERVCRVSTLLLLLLRTCNGAGLATIVEQHSDGSAQQIYVQAVLREAMASARRSNASRNAQLDGTAVHSEMENSALHQDGTERGTGWGVEQDEGWGVEQNEGWGRKQDKRWGTEKGTGWGVEKGAGWGTEKGAGWGVEKGLERDRKQDAGWGVEKGAGWGREQDAGCKCVKFDCGCCVHASVKKIHLDDTVCVNVTYLPRDYGISVTLTVGKRTILNVTVSARNPPPLCVGVPFLEKAASLCVDLYNLDISASAFTGCARLEARLLHIVITKLQLGCFRIPLNQPPSEQHLPPISK